MRLLLIEGDPDFSSWLSARLSGAGFVSHGVASAKAALRHDLAGTAAALLVDIALDGPSGATLVRPLRDGGLILPVMVLSPIGDWREKVACLDCGADDYVVKPVRSEEVAARLRAIVRRHSGNSSGLLTYGDITLDPRKRCAWQGRACLDLTRNEFRLLQMLLLAPNRLAPRHDLMSVLRAATKGAPSDNALDALVARLRGKIGKDRIKTVRGMGYRLIVSETDDPVSDNDRESCCRS
ncbi:MAG: response regulator transcription factor [Sphingomonadales bacterium]|nr:response regulator transcription factor [Sphingomonadales bacterium]MDE2568745.1 response regulator transcription factor [Sphingomonadales bacterium]